MTLESGTLAARDADAVLHPYTNLPQLKQDGPMMMSRGDGVHVWDEHGNKYIEALAGLWCTSLGYGNEELAQAAYDQIRTLSYQHMFIGKSHEPGALLAEKIKEMVPMEASKVFFGCSGSDANDTQIKMLWYYNNARGKPQKKKIISRIKAYHGITLAATSLTGLPPVHTHFDVPVNDRFLHTDCPHYYRFSEPGETEEQFADRLVSNLEELILKEDPETIAGFIAEPVMGAGGVIVPPATYFEKVEKVLRKYDIIFISDEVITGFGRTGKPFGCETFNFTPDTMSMAKALTSAYQPLSAVVIPERMYETIANASAEVGNFGHGYTFSGHPVAAAVGLKTLEIYERDGVMEHAAHLGKQFQDRIHAFADHPLVGETRGVGMIGACEMVADKDTKTPFDPASKVGIQCMERCKENGIIVRAIGDSIAFCPPLVGGEEMVDEIFDRFKKSLDETLDWVTKEKIGAA